MVAEIDPDRPWEHEKAAEWDTISWDAWLRAQTDDDEAVRNLAFATGSAMLTKPTHAFSLLQSLLMAACAGSYSHLVDADFILDKRVVGGLQQVPLLLAERLGDDVLLGQPVRTLEWTRSTGVDARHRHDSPDRARPVRDPRARPGALQPHPVRPRPAAPAAPDAPAHLDGLRHQGARRLRPAVLARAGALRHRVQPVRALARGLRQHQPRRRARHPRRLRLRPARRRRVPPLAPRSARSASSSRSRTTTAPRRRTRSSTTRATGAPRSGRAAPTRRASTWAVSPATAPTSARPSARSTSPAATWPARATSTSTARSAWVASSPPPSSRRPAHERTHRRRLHRHRGRSRTRSRSARGWPRHPNPNFDIVAGAARPTAAA